MKHINLYNAGHEYYTITPGHETYIVKVHDQTAIVEVWKYDRCHEYVMQRQGDMYTGGGYTFTPSRNTLMEEIN